MPKNPKKTADHLLIPTLSDKKIIDAKISILQTKRNRKKISFVVNGASASIGNHASLDFTKQGKVKSVNFNESAFITAFSNDYGYENWIANVLRYQAKKKDLETNFDL